MHTSARARQVIFHCNGRDTNLDKTSAAIEIEMQLLDRAKVSEVRVNVLLGGLLVQSSDKDQKALDRCYCKTVE